MKPITPEEAKLGWQFLYFRLTRDGVQIECNLCSMDEYIFAKAVRGQDSYVTQDWHEKALTHLEAQHPDRLPPPRHQAQQAPRTVEEIEQFLNGR